MVKIRKLKFFDVDILASTLFYTSLELKSLIYTMGKNKTDADLPAKTKKKETLKNMEKHRTGCENKANRDGKQGNENKWKKQNNNLVFHRKCADQGKTLAHQQHVVR